MTARSASVLALSILASCARVAPQPEIVEAPLVESRVAAGTIRSPVDAAALAEGMAGLLAVRLPPGAADGPLHVRPAAGDTEVARALESALRRLGYAVVQDGRHAVAYMIGPLDRAVVAQVTVDGRFRAARAFARSGSGPLRASANGGVMVPEGAR